MGVGTLSTVVAARAGGREPAPGRRSRNQDLRNVRLPNDGEASLFSRNQAGAFPDLCDRIAARRGAPHFRLFLHPARPAADKGRMSVHHAAARGFRRRRHDLWARPSRLSAARRTAGWPSRRCGVGPGVRVLDLGAGTGKFTDRLLAEGAETVAVEPVAEMAAALAGRLPAARVLAGSAEAIPCRRRPLRRGGLRSGVPLVLRRPQALAEIRRVLKPQGALGLIWNVRDESGRLGAGADRYIFAPYEGDAPRFQHRGLEKRVSGAGFSPARRRALSWAHVGPVEDVVLARTLSISFIAALPADERDKIEASVRRLIETHAGVLAGGGDVAFPYVTEAYVCRAEGCGSGPSIGKAARR